MANEGAGVDMLRVDMPLQLRRAGKRSGVCATAPFAFEGLWRKISGADQVLGLMGILKSCAG
jgi:hypothetical protein